MNRSIILSVFSLAVILWGCASSNKVVLNPEYKGKSLSERKLQILPIPFDAISIENKGDVQDDFSKDMRPADLIIQDIIYTKIREVCGSRIQNVTMIRHKLPYSLLFSQTSKDSFDVIVKTLGKETPEEHNFFVPKKSVIADSGMTFDMALVLNKMVINRITGTYSSSAPGHYVPGHTISTPGGTFSTPGHFMGGGVASAPHLTAVVHFIIWDYQNNCDVAYGIVKASGYTYESTAEDIASEILEDTPFELIRLKKKY